MKRVFWFAAAFTGILLVLAAQQSDVVISWRAATAPPLRCRSARQRRGPAVDERLQRDALQRSGRLRPFQNGPQNHVPAAGAPAAPDFREQPPPQPTRPGQQPRNGGGAWLSDWSSPPVSANYLAFGYTAVQNNVLVFYGWLFNVGQATVSQAQVLGKRYFGSPDEAGARKRPTNSPPIS